MFAVLYGAPDIWPDPCALSGRKTLSLPAPPPPPPMPDPEDPEIRAKRRAELAAASLRSGRLSTILTDDSGYNRDKLGLR